MLEQPLDEDTEGNYLGIIVLRMLNVFNNQDGPKIVCNSAQVKM